MSDTKDLDLMRNRAERAESALATERAVNALLVRQIQAVRAMQPCGRLAEYGEYLRRSKVLKLLSPQGT